MTTWTISVSNSPDTIEVQTRTPPTFQFTQIPVFNPRSEFAWVSGQPDIQPLDLLEEFREPLKEFLTHRDISSFSMEEVPATEGGDHTKVQIAYLSKDLVHIYPRDAFHVSFHDLNQGETDAAAE